MTKVKIIRGTAGIGYGYFAGDTPELEPALAAEFIETGFAIPFTEEIPAEVPAEVTEAVKEAVVEIEETIKKATKKK